MSGLTKKTVPNDYTRDRAIFKAPFRRQQESDGCSLL